MLTSSLVTCSVVTCSVATCSVAICCVVIRFVVTCVVVTCVVVTRSMVTCSVVACSVGTCAVALVGAKKKIRFKRYLAKGGDKKKFTALEKRQIKPAKKIVRRRINFSVAVFKTPIYYFLQPFSFFR